MRHEAQEQSPPKNKGHLLFLMLALSFFSGASLLCWLTPTSKPAPLPLPVPFAYPLMASPHFDARPAGATISAVIIHATTIDSLEESVAYFLAPTTEVSTHFVVGRDGTVNQLVPVEARAWHAGKSLLDGVEHVNDFSVGIELVNLNDGVEDYPEMQYEATAGIVRLLRATYQLPNHRILSHGEVATPLGRKTDPRGFDLTKLRELINTGRITH